MNITLRFIQTKPKCLLWLYYLMFGVCLLVATPFVAMGVVAEICAWFGHAIVQFISNKLNIDFTV